jgi:hypothetical protein
MDLSLGKQAAPRRLDPILRRLRYTGSGQLCVEPLRYSQVLEHDGQRL